MAFLDLLELIPVLRWIIRKFLERKMEIEVKPHLPVPDSAFLNVSVPDLEKKIPGIIFAFLDISAINHNSDKPERIIGCWAELRKIHLLFWHKPICKIPAKLRQCNLELENFDILLEPISSPKKFCIKILGNYDNVVVPRKTDLVLVFRMVGQMRRYVKRLTYIENTN